MSALNHGSSPSARYQALDYLRGVAALVVVAYHAFPVSHLPNLLPSGYLAVDFFFLLSGFVLAHGYEPKLLSGALSFRRFATLRFYRLMPLVIVGVLLGGALLLAKSLVAPDKVGSASSVIRAIVLNGLLLPDPFYVSPSPKWDGSIFPVDSPLWSLFFEVFVNLFWVGFLVARSRWLVLCLLVSVVALATGCHLSGSGDIGWDRVSFWWGFPRVFVGFLGGVVLFKLKAYFPKSVNVSIGWMVLVLLGCFGLPPSVWKDLLCVLVVFPLVIVCAAQMNDFEPHLDLGAISFAIYAVHQPIILWISAVQQYVAPKLSSGPLFASMLLLPICAAYVLNRYWDVPIQRWLKQR